MGAPPQFLQARQGSPDPQRSSTPP